MLWDLLPGCVSSESMVIHRKRGRPRVGEDAAVHRATLRIPVQLWALIERLAKAEGITAHAWMRKALDAQATADAVRCSGLLEGPL